MDFNSTIRHYILNLEEHHKTKSFKEEYLNIKNLAVEHDESILFEWYDSIKQLYHPFGVLYMITMIILESCHSFGINISNDCEAGDGQMMIRQAIPEYVTGYAID